MDAFQDRDRHDALRVVQQNVVDRCYGEDNPIGKRQQGRRVVVLPLHQLVKIGAEPDAGRVGLDAWKHESRLVNLGFPKAIDSVLKVGGVSRR